MTFFVSILTRDFRFWTAGWKDCPTVGLICLLFVHNAALIVFCAAGTAIASAKE